MVGPNIYLKGWDGDILVEVGGNWNWVGWSWYPPRIKVVDSTTGLGLGFGISFSGRLTLTYSDTDSFIRYYIFYYYVLGLQLQTGRLEIRDWDQKMGGEAAAGGVFKFLSPRLRPQSTDIQAAVFWGVAATTTAIWLVQVSLSSSTF